MSQNGYGDQSDSAYLTIDVFRAGDTLYPAKTVTGAPLYGGGLYTVTASGLLTCKGYGTSVKKKETGDESPKRDPSPAVLKSGRTNRRNTGKISADRSTKTTLMLTIPGCN